MTDRLTGQQLDDIEARANAATPGPWRLCDDYSDVLNPDGYQLASYAAPADGEFIAHARTDVPALLAEIRRLRAELATARAAAITDVGNWLDDHGQEDAAYLVRTVDIPAVVESHVVADDSSDPEHIDDCPGCDAADTLPVWLAQRFDPRGPDWDALADDDRTYWEHHAAAVRRAVARCGFKAAEGAQR